jgi:hypothetical protein
MRAVQIVEEYILAIFFLSITITSSLMLYLGIFATKHLLERLLS